MKIKASDLTTERKWRATTGLNKNRFYKLLDLFIPAYLEVNGKSIACKQKEMQTTFVISSEEELLLFTLLSLKSGMSYDLLGLISGMEASNAKRNQETGLISLKRALHNAECMPKREFNKKEEVEAFFAGIDDLVIDATEQKIQRPLDREKRKEYYSGKQKHHTVKSMVISIKNSFIGYVSPCVEGKIHDFNLLKTLFSPDEDWFRKFNIKVDAGYLGFLKKYKCKSLSIPYKKTKNKALTDEQKAFNKQLASERIVVEHSFCGMKRYRILSDRLRMHDIDLYDEVLVVCAGLWNFYLSASH